MRWLGERDGTDVAEIGIAVGSLRYLDRTGGIAAELPTPYRFSSYEAGDSIIGR